MKKYLLTVSAVIFAVLALFCGCNGGTVKKTYINDDTGIIIVPDKDYDSLADYILVLKDGGKLDVEYTMGAYGMFITAIDGKANEVTSSTATAMSGYSWTIYIDFVTLDGVIYGQDSKICDYKGKTLYSANYGASALPCIAGHTYALVYESYSYEF